jgi:hypothetical protein
MKFLILTLVSVSALGIIGAAKPSVALERVPCAIRFDSVGKGQGTRMWGGGSETAPCLGEGSSCKIKVIYCSLVGAVEPATGGGYTLFSNITSLDFATVGISPPQESAGSSSNFLFKNGDAWVTITNCSAYPQLNGVSVNMNGVSTNSSGDFAVFLPVYN